MIHHIDAAVESFVRQVVGVSEHVADVVSGLPSSFSEAGLARPTFVIHLWDISQNMQLNRGGFEDAVDGVRPARRPSSPILNFRYFVTVVAGELRDEHELLGRLLTAILVNDKLPKAILPGPLQELRIGLQLSSQEEEYPGSSWEPGKRRFGLSFCLSVPAEIGSWLERGTPIESISVSTGLHGIDSRGRDTAPNPDREDLQPLRRRRDGSTIVMEGKSPSTRAPK
ncbi:MAG: Pvc16 family protein [Ferrimicrobium acidiphilum]